MKNKALICTACNGEMNEYTGYKHSKGLGVFLILSGIFCILFWIGAVLGIPLFIIGMYMTSAKRNLWVCQDCQMAVERIPLKNIPQKEKGQQAAKTQTLDESRVESA